MNKKILIYVFLVLLFYGLFVTIYNLKFKSYSQQELAYNDLVAKKSDLLFIGTSHFYSSIDPDYIDKNITTLSAGSLNYLYQYEILKNAFKINDKIKNIFIEVDYIPLLINTLDNRVRRFECDFTDLFSLGLNYESLPGLSYGKYLVFKFKSLIGFDSLLSAPALNLKEIVFFNNNNYKTKKLAGFLNSNKTYDLTVQERIPKAKSVYDQLEINTQAFINIINLCKTQNIKITYIKFPRYKPILNYQKYIIDLINQYDTENYKLFCANNDVSFEINDFKDNNHLNISGAKKFSTVLNNYLNQNNY